MIRMLRNHPKGLGMVLFLLFLVSWIGQFITQMVEYANEAREHGVVFDFSDFLVAFWSRTFENWQSEYLQLLSFVVLTTYFIFAGSHESKDGQDRMEAKVDALSDDVSELRAMLGRTETRG